MRSITYGPGGFDPTKPNGNVVEDREVPDPPIDPKVARLNVLKAKPRGQRTPAENAEMIDLLMEHLGL